MDTGHTPGTPTVADFIAYARLMNGVCKACGTINAHDGSPRCDCAEGTSIARKAAGIDAKGGYPRQRLAALGCEVRQAQGVMYARWPLR